MAEPAGPDGCPESHEAWASASMGLVGGAQTATKDLLASLEGTEHVLAEDPLAKLRGQARIVDKGPQHTKKLDGMILIARRALDSVEKSSQRCATIHTLLQHERQAKWAALKVVEWRLALREKRPKPELFRDSLQEALEHEKQILEDSRKVLADKGAEVKVCLQDCEANRLRLMRSVRSMVCDSDPNPRADTLARADASVTLEEGALSEGGPDSTPTAMKRPPVPSDTNGLIERAPQLHEITCQLLAKGEKLMERQKDICEKANERTMAAFPKRYAENRDLKIQLEAQIREMNEAIETAEKSISRMNKDIEFFKRVELQPKVDSTNALLEKIKASKQQLTDDLLRKVVSMRIDDCCKKITPERTGQSPDSMPVAALLDFLDAGGEPTKKKAALLEGTGTKIPASKSGAKAFANGNIDSAASTAVPDSAASTQSKMERTPSKAGLSLPLKGTGASVMKKKCAKK